MYMKLYYSPTSPYARKTLVVARELNLGDLVEVIITNPLESSDELVKNNPLSRVPTLVGEDGLVLYDSPLICEYFFSIADKATRKKLYSSDGIYSDSYFKIQRLHALADGVMDANFSLVIERKRDPEQQSPLWKQRWLSAINRGLENFSKLDSSLLEPLTVGSISMCCALGYLSFRTQDIEWQQTYPVLDDWYHTMLLHDSLRETDPCSNQS